jgi:regulator of sigma E protease
VILNETWRFLTGLFSGRLSPKLTGGPVEVVRSTAVSLERGYGFYFWLVAIISLNLAVINLLPLPVLDGGHIVFLLYEGVRGRPVSQQIQGWLQFAGLLLIVGILILATWNDVQRIFFSD